MLGQVSYMRETEYTNVKYSLCVYVPFAYTY